MTKHYTTTAKVFHWLTAGCVAVLLALGWYMTTLDLSPLMLKLYSWHKWIGISVLLITVLRLIWRITHRAPPLPDTMPRLMQISAHGGHVLLYGLLIAMPLAGWIHSSAGGFPVVWFSVMQLPDLVSPSKQISDLFSWLHWIGGWLLVALLIGHIGATLWHHTVKRDDVLTRMLPGGKGLATLVLAGLMATGIPRAQAGSTDIWQIDNDASEMTFSALQMNVPIKGRFQAYVATIVFDPANPQDASIKLEIDATSITTGNAQADQALPGPDWFAAAEHPTAVFESNGFKSVGENVYEVAGTLTLKGHSESVTLMATIAILPDQNDSQSLVASATGETKLSRTAFKIGEGQWSNTATIADEVVVAFNFSARRAK